MAPIQIQPFSRPEWAPLPYEGCINVESKGLARLEKFSVAMLRFAPNGTIHEHAAEIDIDVFCLEGEGMTSIAGESAMIRAGERAHWPTGQPHRLWTTDKGMVTLMIEHA